MIESAYRLWLTPTRVILDCILELLLPDSVFIMKTHPWFLILSITYCIGSHPARRQQRRPPQQQEPEAGERQNPDEPVDIRYVGGHIPSQSFKMLQHSIGAESPVHGKNCKNCLSLKCIYRTLASYRNHASVEWQAKSMFLSEDHLGFTFHSWHSAKS